MATASRTKGKMRRDNPAPGIKFVYGIIGKGAARVSEVQSVLFDKASHTVAQAKKWLAAHGFKHGAVDEGGPRAAYHRFRQQEPGKYHTMRTGEVGGKNPDLAEAWTAISQQAQEMSATKLAHQYEGIDYETKVVERGKGKSKRWVVLVRKQIVGSPGRGNPEMTLAQHAEAWQRERGKQVPARGTKAYGQMYEEWIEYAFADQRPGVSWSGRRKRKSGAGKGNPDLRRNLANALTEYDRRQSTKSGYNRYALPHYLGALHEAEAKIDQGIPVRDALKEHFTGHVLNVVLRAAGESKASTKEQRWSNPADSAADLYEDFHGTPSTKETVIAEEIHYHGELAELGKLTELKLHTISGYDATLGFDSDPPLLCASKDGRQLYLRGGDQSLDLGKLHMAGGKWERDSMVLGVLVEMTYRTAKGFDHFKLSEYYHKLGEVTGVQPMLVYDRLNQMLSVAGGQYEVKPEGIVG